MGKMGKISEKIFQLGCKINEEMPIVRAYKDTYFGPAACGTDHGHTIFSLSILFPDGRKEKLFPDEGKVIIGTGADTVEEAERLVLQGVGIKVTMRDIYRDFYNLDHDAELNSFFEYRHSCRTHEYLEQERKAIGLLSYTVGGDGTPEGQTTNCKVIRNEGSYLTGLLPDGRYIVEHGVACGYDDSALYKFYFDHLPTALDICTANSIYRITSDLYVSSEVYTCPNCLHQTHWLDVPGDIFQKYEHFRVKCCECTPL